MEEVKRTVVLQHQKRGKLPFALSKYTIQRTASTSTCLGGLLPELLTDIGQEASLRPNSCKTVS